MSSKNSLADFDPQQVAKLEAQMWQAYYAHKFFRIMRLAIVLFREQFKVSTLTSLRLGYYAMSAAMVFRKTGNIERTETYIRVYYKLVRRHATEDFDTALAAKTEIEWWVIQRYPSRGSLAQGIAENMAIVYSMPPQKLKTYAEERAKAMKLRHIAAHTEKREPDWQAIARHLETSYEALSRAVNHAR